MKTLIENNSNFVIQDLDISAILRRIDAD